MNNIDKSKREKTNVKKANMKKANVKGSARKLDKTWKK